MKNTIQSTLKNFVPEDERLAREIISLKKERDEISHKERFQLIGINTKIQLLEENFIQVTGLDKTSLIPINPLNMSRIVESEIKFRFGGLIE